MKINYLILENFSNIQTALGTKKIKIDFTKAENKVILLVGRNGSGKTSILSMLTPFANVGGLDIRNSMHPIISGLDGYKEIQIVHNNDVYTIKHYYIAKKDTHSVKSYIEKNGVELNINGNVTSFKEWVKIELHVEPDYLKLVRLGANVSSMISMTEGERKTFMNKLLEEADVFLSFFKKVNVDLRQLKEMISHAVDKQNRLGVESIESVKSTIRNFESQKTMKEKDFQDISNHITVLQYDIDQIEDSSTLRERLSNSERKLSKMKRVLSAKNYESDEPNFYQDKIQELTLQNASLTSKIETSTSLLMSAMTRLDQLHNTYHDLEVQYQKEMEASHELKKMKEELRKLTDEIENVEKTLPQSCPDISKDDIEKFIVFLKVSQDKINRAYEFGRPVIRKIIQLLKKGKNVQAYINNNLINLSVNSQTDYFLQKLSRQFQFDSKLIDECENTSCYAKKLYYQVGNLLNTMVEESDDKIDREMLNSMEFTFQIISQVLLDFKEFDSIIKNLPDGYKDDFLIDVIYQKLYNMECLYDEKKLNSLLSVITEFHDYKELQEKRDTQEKLYNQFLKFGGSSFIGSQLSSTSLSIQETEDEILGLKNSISSAKEEIDQNNKSLEVYKELLEVFTDYDELSTKINQLRQDWELYQTNIRAIREESQHLDVIKQEIKLLESKINQLRQRNIQYAEIMSDLRTYKSIYDEMLLVKESLSSTKGIPLRFIKNYLGNTEEIANELLDIAFNGDIYLDRFRITQSEFTIPFYNRGKLLPDVKFASQGETAFISIALAFALSTQTMQEYNIMLLDEIDSALDIKYKEKFLSILENQMERMKTEQCFFITHSDMFSSYPVDVISLTPDFEIKNTIEIEKD